MSTQDKTEREVFLVPDNAPDGLTSSTVYLAYMLRLWRAGSRGGQPVWRASLENPHTGERLAFGVVEDLFAYLTERMGVCAETPGGPEEMTPVVDRAIAPAEGCEC